MRRALPLLLSLLLLAPESPARDTDRARELRAFVREALDPLPLGPGDLQVRDQLFFQLYAERFRTYGVWQGRFDPPPERDPLRPALVDRTLRHPLALVTLGAELTEGRIPEELRGLLGSRVGQSPEKLVERAEAGLTKLDREVRRLLPHRDADRRIEVWMTGGIEPGDLPAARRAFDRLGRNDYRPLARAALTLAHSLALPGTPPDEGWPEKEPRRIETPAGTVVLGTPGNDVYREDVWMIVDPGGNDLYLNNAGSARSKLRTALVLDLAGDDRYLDDRPFTQGSAHLGAGLLVDLGGNDLYRAKDFAQGAALGGVGVLLDAGGTDHFLGDRFVQGAAAFGVGKLTALGSGNDRYLAGQMGQGFARTAGYGLVEESGGNDLYLCGRDYPSRTYSQWTGGRLIHWSFVQGCSLGFYCRYGEPDGSGGSRLVTRELFPGGVGLLLDHGGDDDYQGSMYAQGTAYFYGLGVLVDREGNDRYRATWYGQGAAPHFAAGLLADGAGNDVYEGMHQVQGNGRDFSTGVLLDLDGNDRYLAEDRVQGCGDLSDAFGILLDRRGDDLYEATRATARGYATAREPNRPFRDVGLFLDLGGKDRYRGPALGADGSLWIQGETGRGAGLDR